VFVLFVRVLGTCGAEVVAFIDWKLNSFSFDISEYSSRGAFLGRSTLAEPFLILIQDLVVDHVKIVEPLLDPDFSEVRIEEHS